MENKVIGRTILNSKDLNTKVKMSTGVVCPSCRVAFPPGSLISPEPFNNHSNQSTPLPLSCHESQQKTAGHCFASQLDAARLPVPYVCRHWLRVGACSLCSPLCNVSSPSCPLISSVGACPCSLGRVLANSCHKTGQFQNSHCRSGKENECNIENLGGIWPQCAAMAFLENSFNCSNSLTSNLEPWGENDDAEALASSKSALEESGWYYGSLSWQAANDLLSDKAEGTFLIRDSSSKRCPFALSVQTSQGPTSIRIEYERGRFWLACERKGITPQATSVIQLVELYTSLSLGKNKQKGSRESNLDSRSLDFSRMDDDHVWIDYRGNIFSPIAILKPLRKGPLSLQHLCRVAARSLPRVDLSYLPSPVRSFLSKYEYTL